MNRTIETIITETKQLFDEGVITIDEILAAWAETMKALERAKYGDAPLTARQIADNIKIRSEQLRGNNDTI